MFVFGIARSPAIIFLSKTILQAHTQGTGEGFLNLCPKTCTPWGEGVLSSARKDNAICFFFLLIPIIVLKSRSKEKENKYQLKITLVTVSEMISECINALHNVYKLFS